jgi:hypothetical protein
VPPDFARRQTTARNPRAVEDGARGGTMGCPRLEEDAERRLLGTAAAQEVYRAVEIDLDPLGDALRTLVAVSGPPERAQPPVDHSRELGIVDDICLGGGHDALSLVPLAVRAHPTGRFAVRARL